MKETEFQELVWQKGRELYRDMPWRSDHRPYYVLVSELMLQQTQVERVIPKFELFVATFPTVESLAYASLSDVLALWSGLGYNRRAKFLHEAAKMIANDFAGEFPQSLEQLVSLPGVGGNTAGAIMAYSFNQPVVFVETNIRTVYFHHFFGDDVSVTDSQIRDVVSSTLDKEHAREWYWALMDYGTFLKRQGVGAITKSRHYKKQSPLAGSVREVRGAIIKQLVDGALTITVLKALVPNDERFDTALSGLVADGLVANKDGHISLVS